MQNQILHTFCCSRSHCRAAKTPPVTLKLNRLSGLCVPTDQGAGGPGSQKHVALCESVADTAGIGIEKIRNLERYCKTLVTLLENSVVGTTDSVKTGKIT